MSGTLARGARGGAFTLFAQALGLIIQFASTILLARLLTPSDFGLIAMVAVFIGVGQLVRDFGMPAAALQARTLSDQQHANVFWVTASLSGVVALALVVLAPLIALIYREERLIEVVPALAGILLLSGLQSQFRTRLAREMRFMPLVTIDVLARLVGLASALVAAASGWGYWALVLQQGSSVAFTLIALVSAARWLPGLPRRGAQTMGLVRTGAHNGIANSLGYAADNADNFMIGLVWGAGPLGLYNRAFQLFMTPVMSFFSPLTAVVVPTANRAVLEGRDPSDILARAQTALCGPAIGLLVVTAVTADPLVPLLLGAQWGGVVPILQILAVGGAFRALSQTNYWAYLIEQRSRDLLMSNLVTKPLQIAMIVVAAFFGPHWVAWAYAAGRAITWPINLLWLQRTTGQSALRFGVNGMRFILSGSVAYAVGWFATQRWSNLEPLAQVGLGALVAILVYLLVALCLPGGRRELIGALALLRSLRRRSA